MGRSLILYCVLWLGSTQLFFESSIAVMMRLARDLGKDDRHWIEE
jgi:hypothetical protein